MLIIKVSFHNKMLRLGSEGGIKTKDPSRVGAIAQHPKPVSSDLGTQSQESTLNIARCAQNSNQNKRKTDF